MKILKQTDGIWSKIADDHLVGVFAAKDSSISVTITSGKSSTIIYRVEFDEHDLKRLYHWQMALD